jgi:hypothetical protein
VAAEIMQRLAAWRAEPARLRQIQEA